MFEKEIILKEQLAAGCLFQCSPAGTLPANAGTVDYLKVCPSMSVKAIFVKYQSTGVEQTEEAKPVNLGPQIAKAHGVTSPQRDFVKLASPARAVAVRNTRNSPKSAQRAYDISGTVAAAKCRSADRMRTLPFRYARSRGTASAEGRGEGSTRSARSH